MGICGTLLRHVFDSRVPLMLKLKIYIIIITPIITYCMVVRSMYTCFLRANLNNEREIAPRVPFFIERWEHRDRGRI